MALRMVSTLVYRLGRMQSKGVYKFDSRKSVMRAIASEFFGQAIVAPSAWRNVEGDRNKKARFRWKQAFCPLIE